MNDTALPTAFKSMKIALDSRLGELRDDIAASALNALRWIITAGMFFGGLYLIETQRSLYVGVVFVGWAFIRASAYVQHVYRMPLGPTLLDAASASAANTTIKLMLKIDAVVDHPSLRGAFDRLRAKGRIGPEVVFADWQAGLVRRFREGAQLPEGHRSWEVVSFDFRAGQIWKNGEYSRMSFIFHEVLIPEESMKPKHVLSHSDDIYFDGLRIRAVVINGILKVQIGKWSEESGYREPKQSSHWMAWDTITTFPLILNSLDHRLPPRLLLLDYFSLPHHRSGWKRAKRRAFRQADEYRRVLSTFGTYGESALWERQRREFKRWLEKEGFTADSYSSDEWHNDFLSINITCRSVESDTYRWLSDEGETYYG
jgi:hypothetical protein